jgi:hypothetical protein
VQTGAFGEAVSRIFRLALSEGRMQYQAAMFGEKVASGVVKIPRLQSSRVHDDGLLCVQKLKNESVL